MDATDLEQTAFEEAWNRHPASRQDLPADQLGVMKEFAKAFWDESRSDITSKYIRVLSEVKHLKEGESAHDAAVRIIRENQSIVTAIRSN